jgi:hypothetical protein
MILRLQSSGSVPTNQSEPTFAGIRPTDVPPFRAAQIVGARFAFFVSLAHVSMGNPGESGDSPLSRSL